MLWVALIACYCLLERTSPRGISLYGTYKHLFCALLSTTSSITAVFYHMVAAFALTD